jgi:hypothetical protein
MHWEKKVEQRNLGPSQMYPFSMTILSCGEQSPPTRITDRVTTCRRIEDQIDVSTLPELRSPSGIMYKSVYFSIEMKVIGNALEFTLIYKTQRMGQQNVEVDLDEERILL